ncbi:MAG: hypothetical protein ACREOU_04625 [Candidatus Eiseniibacteriota bacterium]
MHSHHNPISSLTPGAAVAAFRVLAVLLVSLVGSDAPPASAARWDYYSNANVLNSVSALDGLIWCNSDLGLHSFDPATGRFTRITKDPERLASNAVVDADRDAAGNLWFGTKDRGVSVLSPRGTWRTLTAFDGLPSDSVTALEPSAIGMWIGTRHGLALFDGFELTALWPDGVNPSPFASNFVNDVAIVGDSTWVATNGGIYVTRTTEGVVWDRRANGLSSSIVRAVTSLGTEVWCVAGGGVFRGGETGTWSAAGAGLTGNAVSLRGTATELLCGTTTGVFRSAGGGPWEPLGTGFPALAAVEFDETGTYWAGNFDGLWRWNGTNWAYYRSDGPGGSWIQGMGLEGSTIYVATRDGGAGRFDGTSWRNYLRSTVATPDTTLLSNDFVFGMLVDSQGRKWFGDWGGSLARLSGVSEPPSFEHLYEAGEPGFDERNTFVWASAEDRSGNLWFGLDTRLQGVIIPKGLNRVEPNGTRTNFNPIDGAPMSANQVRAIAFAPGPAFEMWVGYNSAGVDIFTDPDLTVLDDHLSESPPTDPDRLLSNDIWGIEMNGDSVWIATSKGLCRYSRSTRQLREALETQPPSSQGAVHPLSIERDGGVWWATKAGVFHRRSDRSVEVFTEANSPLTSDDVHSVVADRATGVIWIGTVAGLHRYDPQGVPDGGGTVVAPTFYVYPNPVFESSGGFLVRAIDIQGPFKGRVFDVHGRQIVGKILGNATTGPVWNGRDDFGVIVPPGLYFIQVVQDGITRTGRVVLFR